MKKEQVSTGLMVSPVLPMTFEKSLENNPCWKAWVAVRPLLKVYGNFPFKNGKGSYTLYLWDKTVPELKQFWDSFTKEDRYACGLTAHVRDDELMVYEMGFQLKSHRKSKPKVKIPLAEKGTCPAVEKELARRARQKEIDGLSLGGLLYEVFIGKRIKKLRDWLKEQALN